MLHALATKTKRNDVAGAQTAPVTAITSQQRDAYSPVGSARRGQPWSDKQHAFGNQGVLRMLDRGPPRDHAAGALHAGKTAGAVRGARGTADAAELPRGGELLDPGVDLAQVEAPVASDAAPAPAGPVDAAEGSCCKYDTFEASNDSYTDTDTDTRKNIKFTVKLKTGGDASKCVLVNWVKGTAKNKDGTFRQVQMFEKVIDYNFPDMRIDSLDKDPVYWSDSSARWNYTKASATEFSATDSPGPTTWADGIDYNLQFKMCLHCIDDVATTSDAAGSGVKNPLKCIPWTFKAKYDAATKKFTH